MLICIALNLSSAMTNASQHSSQRMKAVQAPIIPIVGQWVRETPGTISLGQGIVYYGPPPQIHDTLQQFGHKIEDHLYHAVQGIPELREQIAKKLAAENHISKHKDQSVFVTSGANLAFSNAVFAIADPGDEIILPAPYYFNHEMAIMMANSKPVIVPTKSDYQLDVEALKAAITPKTRAIVTVSPNNPTGVVYSEADLRAVNQICKDAGIYHMSDEAYEYFTYDGIKHFSPGAIENSHSYTISLFSLSKAYGFAGWRIGYMLIPAHLFEPIRKIQDTQLICPAIVSQHVALTALKAGKPYCEEKIPQIQTSREIFLEALASISDIAEVPTSSGAFYFFLRLKHRLPAIEMVERLIKEYGVAAIPGSAFGADDATYLRIAYGALDEEKAREGIQRLVKGLRGIRG